MLITVEGVVTKAINIGENDKLIAVLTKDRGLIYAFINNCKQIKSKMLAASEICSYCKFVLFKNKEKYTVNEVQILSQFSNIRLDVNKLALSCYLLQIVNEVVGENQTSDEYLRLILNSLYVLDNNKKNLTVVKSVFELKVASIAGYMPNLTSCYKCGTNLANQFYYFILSGEIVCEKCHKDVSVKYFKMTYGVFSAMKYIIYSDASKIFSFNLSDDDAKILYDIAENYLLFKTEINFSKLKYFNQLMFNKN